MKRHIWIINPYGNIPGEDWQTYRTTLLAEALAASGYEVTSWISNIQHRSKTKRAEDWTTVQAGPGYQIHIVPSVPYQDHISLARIRYERTYAHHLQERAISSTQRPDLIILADPALFISDIVVKMVKELDTKLVVDVLDIWPELFHMLLPKKLAALGKLLFSPLYWRRNHLFKRADGLLAVTSDYLAIATKANPDVPSQLVYLGVDCSAFSQAPPTDDGIIQIIYAGTLGENYDIRSLMQAAVRLEQDYGRRQAQENGQSEGQDPKQPSVKILIAGDGPLKGYITEQISKHNLQHTQYLGTLHPTALNQLYQRCDIAVSSYISRSTVSMPVKAYDYLAAGLPMVNSLGRDLGQLVSSRQVGINYEAENSEALYQALKYLIEHPAERARMRANAIALAAEFDIRVQYPKAVRLIDELLEGNTTIRSLRPADAPAMAKLHVQAFPGFFLSSLGEAFLRAFYRQMLKHPLAVGTGSFHAQQLSGFADQQLNGFAVGSLKQQHFYRQVFLRGWWPLGWAIVRAIVQRPMRLVTLVQRLRAGFRSTPPNTSDSYAGSLSRAGSPSHAEQAANAAVLLSIAVHPRRAGQGIGAQVLGGFESAVQQSGAKGLTLTTDAENNYSANQFYIKNNYIFVRPILQGQRIMNVYFKAFSA